MNFLLNWIYQLFTFTYALCYREEQATEQVELLKEEIRKLERNWYANLL
jgi:hypothetical protein